MAKIALDGVTITDEYGAIIARAESAHYATTIVNALNAIAHARQQFNEEYDFIDPDDWDRFTAEDIIAVGEGRTTFINIAWGVEDGYEPTRTSEEAEEVTP